MPLIAAHQIAPRDADIVIYNGYDAAKTLEIEHITSAIDCAHAQLAYEVMLGLQAPAMEMMLRGFRVDPIEREKAIKRIKEKKQRLEVILSRFTAAITGKPYNEKFPNSGKQLRELFYERMNLKPIEKKNRKTGLIERPMDRATLERLADEHFYAEPIANAVLLHRNFTGFLEDLETLLDGDGRWRTSFNLTGTTTFRWSASKSGLGSGGNLQNITEQNRIIFIADQGCKLCGIDAEQSEARDVGWFCGTILGKWKYLDTIESGDIHTRVARMCWPELAWTGDIGRDRQIADQRFYRWHTRRDTTKRLGHGSNYKGKPLTMSTQTKIPLSIVRPFQERYFDAFPEIPEMHRWHAEKLQRDRCVVNCFGLRRDFFDRPESDETIKGAIANSFQSATFLRVGLGLWRLWKYMGTRIQLLTQLHDANYFQYRLDDDEDELIKEALEHMKVTHYHKLPDGTLRKFTVPCEVQVGFNWAHRWRLREDGTREDWNPRGLDRWARKAQSGASAQAQLKAVGDCNTTSLYLMHRPEDAAALGRVLLRARNNAEA